MLRPILRWSLALALLSVLALLISRATMARGALRLHPCISWSTRELARCGTFAVPERRDGTPGGRMISLRVMILPSRGPTHEAEPLVFFNGGPGSSTVAFARYASWALDALRGTHDLLLVDMRGTGESNALSCDLYSDGGRLAPYLQPMFPAAQVRACAARLAEHADLTQYTTEAAARDFDDVRAALHIDRVNLFGVSYGSRLALEYLRLYSSHVRRAVVVAVLPPEFPIGSTFARGTERALDSAFAECASDFSCRAAVPQPRQDFVILMQRLRARPASVRLWNVRRRSNELITLGAPAVAELLLMDTYSPDELMRTLPLVHSAVATGDYTALAQRLAQVSENRRTGRREGLMLSVLCAEDAPRLSVRDEHNDETLIGAPIATFLEACSFWPRGKASPSFGQRVVSSVPTLLISGGRDPVTPPELADSAALGLSNSERYVDPRRGHGELDDRARARIAAFLGHP